MCIAISVSDKCWAIVTKNASHYEIMLLVSHLNNANCTAISGEDGMCCVFDATYNKYDTSHECKNMLK